MNSPDLPHHNADPNAFLMGGSVPSASFLNIGDSVAGTICEAPTLQQQRDMQTGAPKTWDDGSPMLQLVVTLQTDEHDQDIEDDDGRRRAYVKFNMKRAVADAVRKAKAKSLDIGGHLTITYTGNGEQTKRGFAPPKLYEAAYVPPTGNFLNDEAQDAEPQPVAPAGDEPTSPTFCRINRVNKDTKTGKVIYLLDTPAGEFGTLNKTIADEADRLATGQFDARIDWQTTAKGGRLITKLAQADHQPVGDDSIPF